MNGKSHFLSRTLYIQAENNEGCYGTGQFDIIVEPTPKINKKGFYGTTNYSFDLQTWYPTKAYSYLWSNR
jgi:hypothetical protein